MSWIVEQSCGHVTRWRPMKSWADLNTPRTTVESQPCKGAPIVGWGEWCPRCRNITRVTRVAS